jgi:NAD(P)-dependent dehydrogenase (short-subunit alcohol dehydrogenase family)
MGEMLTAIVTGAAQGIGRAVALRLARDGAKVAAWDTQGEGAEETVRECRKAGSEAHFWTVDVGDEAAVNGAVAEVERRCGAPVRLVNNAGIFPRSSPLDMRLAEWERVLRVNLTGSFICARAVGRSMIAAGGGAIVNTASGLALQGAARGAHYAASKAGIMGLTKSLALDWAQYGIRVNCVLPGITDTTMPRGGMADEQLYETGKGFPLGRIGRPEEIAAVVAFLLGPDAAYMTGQSVAVNGGAIMLP